MTDKVQKIREKVERLKSQLIKGACASQIAMETRCKEEAYNEVLAILNTLQEEPVSDVLDEAAKIYARGEYDRKNPSSLPWQCKGCYSPLIYAFKDGAQWQKQQMMAKAIDAHCFGFQGAALFSFRLPADNYLVGSEVKVIVVEERNEL